MPSPNATTGREGMSGPRVPGSTIELPCGETVAPQDIDLGMRELSCACGDTHAVVTDVHPPARFVPEELVETLRAVVEPGDDRETFGTVHVMGMVLEEFPEAVVAHDATEDGSVGYAIVWVTDFDARRLHEIVVELLVELMNHAIEHTDDTAAADEFAEQLAAFDVEAFVTAYRRERDFEDEHDRPV